MDVNVFDRVKFTYIPTKYGRSKQNAYNGEYFVGDRHRQLNHSDISVILIKENYAVVC